MNCVRPLFSGVIVAAATFAVSGTASGAIFTLSPGSPDFPGLATNITGLASVTSEAEDGIKLTAAADGGNAGGVVNSTNFGGGFGVAGNSSFEISGPESLTLSFDQNVYIDQLSFNGFTLSDSVNVVISSLGINTTVTGGQSFTTVVAGLTSAGDAPATATTPSDFTLNFSSESFELTAGATIILSAPAGNFFVDSVSVSAVPEPGSLALMGLGATFMIRRKR